MNLLPENQFLNEGFIFIQYNIPINLNIHHQTNQSYIFDRQNH
jgi:hypothetical protein